MADLRQFERENSIARRYEYGDTVVLVADVGAGADEGSVDVVGDTAIVVVGDDQYELSLPEGAASAFIRNGVITIEVEQ